MPIPIAIKAAFDGVATVPWIWTALKVLPWLALAWLVRTYFQGASNLSERNMHSKVVMVTGGTSGIGAEVVLALATRGAQIVLLTQHPLGDPFLVDQIEDLRTRAGNELITAEQVDLSSLHSIRTFATKWIDNAPPRRLDMIILCANTLTPKGGKLQSTQDDVEVNWGLNYLANFHLLSILSPAIRAQPPDRDVRIIFGTCASYIGGDLPALPAPEDKKGGASKTKKTTAKAADRQQSTTSFEPASAYATSKLALMTFALAFQKHLTSYSRPDKQPTNSRIVFVDPGYTRTPGLRRYLTWGSLLGLFLYMLTYPFWWIVLKSPTQGAQSFLYAAMEAQWGRGDGGWLIKECREVPLGRQETVRDEGVQQALWAYSEQMVQEAEKRGALGRAKSKNEAEEVKAKEAQDVPKEEPAKKAGSRRSRKAV